MRAPASRGYGAWRWAKRGAAIGAAVGTLVCLSDRANGAAETPSNSVAEGMFATVVWFAGGGALYGALFLGSRWVLATLPTPPGSRR